MPTRTVFAGLALAVLLVASLGTPVPAASAGPTFTRVLMLPLVDRTTLVVELSGAVDEVRELEAAGATVVIELGPIEGGVPGLELTPAMRSPFVDHVSLRATSGRDGRSYLTVRTTLSAACTHRVRTTGSRVYLDFAPLDEIPDAVQAAAPDVAADRERLDKPGAIDAPPGPLSDEAAEAAYRALESSALQRASRLAARPDVKALLGLQDEIVKRDERLGRRQPALVEHLMAQVQVHLERARALQLQKDRGDLLRAR